MEITNRKLDFDVHFGKIESKGSHWRKYVEPDPDDEELEVTPPDVIMILGFDPKDLDFDSD